MTLHAHANVLDGHVRVRVVVGRAQTLRLDREPKTARMRQRIAFVVMRITIIIVRIWVVVIVVVIMMR